MNDSIDALRSSRGCTGQFSTSATLNDPFTFEPTSIELFRYGLGEWLPEQAGFLTPSKAQRNAFETEWKKNIAEARANSPIVSVYYDEYLDDKNALHLKPKPQFIASAAECDLGPGGALCRHDEMFAITGLAARIGRVRQNNRFCANLDRYDLRIREALAAALSIQLEFGEMSSRYQLGSLLTWPLMNSIFGPAVDLEGGSDNPRFNPGVMPADSLQVPGKEFFPFKSIACSTPTSSVSIRVSLDKPLPFESDPAAPILAGLLTVPVQIWLFGNTQTIPAPCRPPDIYQMIRMLDKNMT